MSHAHHQRQSQELQRQPAEVIEAIQWARERAVELGDLEIRYSHVQHAVKCITCFGRHKPYDGHRRGEFVAICQELMDRLPGTNIKVAATFVPYIRGSVGGSFRAFIRVLADVATVVDMIELDVDLSSWSGPVPVMMPLPVRINPGAADDLWCITVKGPCIDWLFKAIGATGIALDKIKRLEVLPSEGRPYTLPNPIEYDDLEYVRLPSSPESEAFVRGWVTAHASSLETAISPALEPVVESQRHVVGGVLARIDNAPAGPAPIPFKYGTVSADDDTPLVVTFKCDGALTSPVALDAVIVVGDVPDFPIRVTGASVLMAIVDAGYTDIPHAYLNVNHPAPAPGSGSDDSSDEEMSPHDAAMAMAEDPDACNAVVLPHANALKNAFPKALVVTVRYNFQCYTLKNPVAIAAASMADCFKLLMAVRSTRMHIAEFPDGLVNTATVFGYNAAERFFAVDPMMDVLLSVETFCAYMPGPYFSHWFKVLAAHEASEMLGDQTTIRP